MLRDLIHDELASTVGCPHPRYRRHACEVVADALRPLQEAAMMAARDAHAAWLRAGLGGHTSTIIEECPNAWCQQHVGAIMQGDAHAAVIDAAHLVRQRDFSLRTFGPGRRHEGVSAHILKELAEAQDDPTEWIDVIILANDGALRAGMEPQAIVDGVIAKQGENEARTWPDWRTADPSAPIEHVRTASPYRPSDPSAPIDLLRDVAEEMGLSDPVPAHNGGQDRSLS